MYVKMYISIDTSVGINIGEQDLRKGSASSESIPPEYAEAERPQFCVPVFALPVPCALGLGFRSSGF